MSLLVQILISFALRVCLGEVFSPDRSDYDAYGPTIAANSLMMVQADNYYHAIYIQFAPYNGSINNDNRRMCRLYWTSSSSYVYGVAIGQNQLRPYFFVLSTFNGSEKSQALYDRVFVFVFTYTGSLDKIDCATVKFTSHFVEGAFVHQDYLVMTTDPLGLVAYGFSNLFSFTYTVATDKLVVHRNNSLFPSGSFLPSAVDYNGDYGIIAGYLQNNRSGRISYSPTVTLFSVDALTAIGTSISNWSYPIEKMTDQTTLTEKNFAQYTAKLDMSVSMNPGATQVLVGIQWLNIVLLFQHNMTNLTLLTLKDNGQGRVGFGKNVVWLGKAAESVAILVNDYSRSYQWSSSQIYIYDSPLTNSSKPISIFPNIQQPLYSYLSPVLLNIITTPTNLVLLDKTGYLFIILSAPRGYYASTIGPDDLAFPATSSHIPCTPGSYKNVTGIVRCSLCPAGTKNNGSNATLTTCVDCAMNTFCPLGSVTDSISNHGLSNVIQAVAYPKSPDVSRLNDILFFTLFSIGSTPRCIVLSPIFWTLIISAIVLLITAVMLVVRHCAGNLKVSKISTLNAALFKTVDWIPGGEMWASGLAIFSVLVLCISCCVFSAKYYSSYPIETAEPSTYTCDTSLRNAQFSSSLQSSSIPVSGGLQEMIDLLNAQAVNLNIALINTVYDCESSGATLTFFSGVNSPSISLKPTCNASNYILYYSVPLPCRQITVQFDISNLHTIGGLRIGLSAPGSSESSTITLRDLGFSYTFNKTGRVLAQDVYSTLTLSKVINSTSPLVSGDDEVLSGIWTGSFTMNYNSSFTSNTDYLTTSPAGTKIRLTLVISETPYYILNEQSPIARLPEIIYHDFLFIAMIIGMLVLIFIVIEVMILPCCTLLNRKWKQQPGEKYREDSNCRSSVSHENSREKDCTQHKHNDGTFDSFAVVKEQTHY